MVRLAWSGSIAWAALAWALLVPAGAAEQRWRPIPPDELTLAAPQVEKDADAEVLFWDVRVEDRNVEADLETQLDHYVRIKVFTERGKESQSRIDIPYLKGVRILDVAGRTTHPDGSVALLKSSDVFERTIVKGRGVKMSAMSFVMPGVEVGAIVEYRWTELRTDHVTWYERLELQRDIPVQRVTYHIKPLKFRGFDLSMRSRVFNGVMTPVTKEPGGFFTASMVRVPAFREEPFMPPEVQVRPWMLLYYSKYVDQPLDDYWHDVGKRMYEADQSVTKPTARLQQEAASAISGSTQPDEQLLRLYRFCRRTIRNLSIEREGLSEKERQALRSKSSPERTLERGFGTGIEIDELFVGLARAAGFDARLAHLSSREYARFDPSFADDYFLNALVAAVRTKDGWRFYDPGIPSLPCGMLRWQEEGVPALIPDHAQSRFVTTPSTPPEASCQRRIALISLDEEGGLQSIGRLEFTGQSAASRRETLAGSSPDVQQEDVRTLIKDRIGGGTVTDIRIEGLEEPEQPLVYRFRLQGPGYAQKVGRRLLLQPAFFQHSLPAVFSGAARRFPVMFPHAWAESDSIVITLPDSMELDHPEAPASGDFGELGEYHVSLATAGGGSVLIYRRALVIRRCAFELDDYPALREAFDAVRSQDAHSLALIRRETESASSR